MFLSTKRIAAYHARNNGVAIVGAGVAGIVIAYELVKNGGKAYYL